MSDRLLIVTQYFAPKNEIAAVRLSFLAVELSKLGWVVDVLTVSANPYNDLESKDGLDMPKDRLGGIRVIEAPVPPLALVLYGARRLLADLRLRLFGSRHEASGDAIPESRSERRGRGNTSGCISRGLVRTMRALIDRSYVRAFVRSRPKGQEYDALWVSYGPSYMINVGVALGKHLPEAALLMDIRDAVVRRWGSEPGWLQRNQRRQEALVADRAEGITIVGLELLSGENRFDIPIEVVTNGFSPVVGPTGSPLGTPDGAFVLYYGGRLYPQQQLDTLVLACVELSGRREVQVHYAGRDSKEFIKAFAVHGAEALVVDHGFVARTESLAMQRMANVNILLSWNNAEKGIMTGKVYELIANNVPILCLVAGDHKNSALQTLFGSDAIRRVFGAGGEPACVSEVVEFLSRISAGDCRLGAATDNGPARYAEYSYSSIGVRLSNFIYAVIKKKEDRHRANALAE